MIEEAEDMDPAVKASKSPLEVFHFPKPPVEKPPHISVQTQNGSFEEYAQIVNKPVHPNESKAEGPQLSPRPVVKSILKPNPINLKEVKLANFNANYTLMSPSR